MVRPQRPGGRKDHPRSRGVYPRSLSAPAPRRGSSPLARGLPALATTACAPWGIIPARAGFTRARAVSGVCIRDHPRSRGVYIEHIPVAGHTGGSSPLARGLLRSADLSDASPRIIPARAGFTRRPPGRDGRHPDHPRSRGVYGIVAASVVVETGSSPLARGLPLSLSSVVGRIGIIPARAGFTGRCGRDGQ